MIKLQYIKVLKLSIFEEYLDYYQGLLNSGEADYLILGNHFNKYTVHTRYYGKMDISDEEIISYKNDLLKALDTNLFSYVAHPDLFMVGKVYFDELCENITRKYVKSIRKRRSFRS